MEPEGLFSKLHREFVAARWADFLKLHGADEAEARRAEFAQQSEQDFAAYLLHFLGELL